LLCPDGSDAAQVAADPPEFFPDVNLDQVVERMLAGLDEYHLQPVLYRMLASPEAVAFRQDVFRDLDGPSLLDRMRAFTERMRTVRSHLAHVARLRLDLQRQAWFLSAARTYCRAVQALADDLSTAEPRSAGLRTVRAYLDHYLSSAGFSALDRESRDVERALGGIVYCLDVEYGKVRVTRFEGQADYAEQVEGTFRRFRGDGRRKVTATEDKAPDLNHVEAAVLEMVAQLFPDQFAALHSFCDRHQDFVDQGVSAVDREAMFYLGYLEYLRPLRQAGFPVCYPEVSRSKEVSAEGAYDLALAAQAVSRARAVVGNDVRVGRGERVLVVTGPNQGGKTTFARMFAQLHHLGALGCPVPAKAARLFLPDQILAHFDRQEDLNDLRGKLEDDLVRIRDILLRATSDSIVVTNELFASTSLADAQQLGARIIREIIATDMLAVYVTFVDELAFLAPQVVSMTATVDPRNPSVRTFHVVRRRADGRAYATAIAAKYGLDRKTLKERLAR
jgi:DNA mismatch repair ATPase MutS